MKYALLTALVAFIMWSAHGTANAGDFPGSSLHRNVGDRVVTKQGGVKTITQTKTRKLLIGKERQTVTQQWTTKIYRDKSLPVGVIKAQKGGQAWEYKYGHDIFIKKKRDGYIVDRFVDNSVRSVKTVNSRAKRRRIRRRQMVEHKRRLKNPRYRRAFKRRRR